MQRPLWASTSTKNPEYSDVLYIDELIGPDTVNTMPEATIAAFLDHGRVERTIDDNLDKAHQQLQALASLGISLDQITTELTVEGVESFTHSFDNLANVIAKKRDEIMSTSGSDSGSGSEKGYGAGLGGLEPQVEEGLRHVESHIIVERIWQKDGSVWKSEPDVQKEIARWLGWLDVSSLMRKRADEITSFAPLLNAVVAAGFTWFAIVLLSDAALSPAATGWVWLGIGTRTVYSMSVNGELPKVFQRINRYGTPIVALLGCTVAGLLFFFPAPSWYLFVGMVSIALTLSYVMGGPVLAVLRRTAPAVAGDGASFADLVLDRDAANRPARRFLRRRAPASCSVTGFPRGAPDRAMPSVRP